MNKGSLKLEGAQLTIIDESEAEEASGSMNYSETTVVETQKKSASGA